MLFSYRVKSKSGEITEAVLEAEDRFSLARDLRSRGFTPISIMEKNGSIIDTLSSSVSDFLSNVSVNEQIILTKNLSGMLKAGLSL